MEQAVSLHYRDFDYIGDSNDAWERFYDHYDRFARSGEYDRDAMKIYSDPQNDKHRGVGTS